MVASTATVHAVGNKAGTETPTEIQNKILNMHIDLDLLAILYTKPTQPDRLAQQPGEYESWPYASCASSFEHRRLGTTHDRDWDRDSMELREFKQNFEMLVLKLFFN